MQQLIFEEAGRVRVAGRARTRRSSDARQALVRPLMVACCDLDVAVAEGVLPMPPGHAVGHEGLAEVVAVGDEVSGRGASATASWCRFRSTAGSAAHAAAA